MHGMFIIILAYGLACIVPVKVEEQLLLLNFLFYFILFYFILFF